MNAHRYANKKLMDFALRVMILEAIFKGKNWPKDQRGLVKAQLIAKKHNITLHENWCTVQDTYTYKKIEDNAKRSFQDAEDLIQDLFSGTASRHPYGALGYIAEKKKSDIFKGAHPTCINSLIHNWLKQRSIDRFRKWEKKDKRDNTINLTPGLLDNGIKNEISTLDTLIKQDTLISLLRSPLGEKLRDVLLVFWNSSKFSPLQSRVLTFILENPELKQVEIANHFGMKKQHINNIIRKGKVEAKKYLLDNKKVNNLLTKHMIQESVGKGRYKLAKSALAAKYLFMVSLEKFKQDK